MNRYIYNIELASGRGARCISLERIYDPMRYFRVRFGEEAVTEVTESANGRKPVPSYLLPLSLEESEAISAPK